MLRLAGIAVSPGRRLGPGGAAAASGIRVSGTPSLPGASRRKSARLDDARDAERAPAARHPRRRCRASAGADLAQPVRSPAADARRPACSCPRARRIIAGRARERRVGARPRVRRVLRGLRGRRRRVPAGTPRRRGRRRRAAAPEPGAGAPAGAGRLLVDLAAPAILVADDLAPSFAAQLDRRAHPGPGARNRQPHAPLRDPRPIARPAGGRRRRGRHPAHPARAPSSSSTATAERSCIDPSPDVLEDARDRRERDARRPSRSSAPTSTARALTSDGVGDPVRGEHRAARRRSRTRGRPAPRGSGCSGPSSCWGRAPSTSTTRSRSTASIARSRRGHGPVPRDDPHVRRRRVAGVAARRMPGRAIGCAERDGALSRGPLGLRAIRLSLSRRDGLRDPAARARRGRAGTARCGCCSRSCRRSTNCARPGRPSSRPTRDVARGRARRAGAAGRRDD